MPKVNPVYRQPRNDVAISYMRDHPELMLKVWYVWLEGKNYMSRKGRINAFKDFVQQRSSLIIRYSTWVRLVKQEL